MTQGEILFLIAFSALIVVMLVRSGEVKFWQAFIAGLLGFCLALTPLGTTLLWLISLVVHAVH
ncbi:hypothetical protein SNA_11155 [Streptomyces natalensis ATCC 27448]|uniref:Uncharacterized protein n=1 Tax=Streptomyces natalensis ATCC 27448 TaxID=1240678 RepID=A0A0D7CP04_9ACTN|nr:hypothetical protein SNA_11155 [Streptomyces natalensis ATCC 27448]